MAPRRPPRADRPAATSLRIVGGKMRGRSFRYNGDPATRPMEDRVREAVFNLLGPAVRNKRAVDLFAGTGAMGFEAISRGAVQATLIERRFPNVKTINENAAALGIADRVRVVAGDAFAWVTREFPDGDQPLVAFCCPPYDFYVERSADMLAMIGRLVQRAPPASLLVVESDARFDVAQLPRPDAWDTRRYAPAVISLYECPAPAG